MTDIRSIAIQFSGKTLPKAEWTHAAHIAVAFTEFDTLGDFETTLLALRTKIRAYNLSVGTANTDSSGYHETLTVFWLTVISQFYAANRQPGLEDKYDRFMKTELASSGFPALFYSRDLLFSSNARLHWVDPDLLDLSEISKIIVHSFE